MRVNRRQRQGQVVPVDFEDLETQKGDEKECGAKPKQEEDRIRGGVHKF